MQHESRERTSGGAPQPAFRALTLGIFLLTLVAYASFFNGGGWNQNAHFALTRALVERGVLDIDAYRYTTFDVSESGGHVYANKPPGLSFFAAPVYALAYQVAGPDLRETLFFLTVAAWICTVAVCAIPGALLVALLAHHLLRLGHDPLVSASVALSTAFGSMIFPFTSVLFLHVASAFFLFLAWHLVRLDERPALAGLAAGLAGLFNYACIPLAAFILGLFVWRSRSLRLTSRFLLGAAGPAAMLAVYQFVVFGNPFVTTIHRFPDHFVSSGASGGVVVMPSIEALFHLTVSPYRGLFFSMPLLLWGVWGALRGVRNSADARVVVAMSVTLLVANASFNGWHTGSSYGPRYLIPLIPLLASYAADQWSAATLVRRIAVAWSAGVAWLATAVNPLVSETIGNPLTEYLIPLFVRGRLPRTLDGLAGEPWHPMTGHVSVNAQTMVEAIPYTIVPPDSPPAFWTSFNLAELLLPGEPTSVVLIGTIIAGGCALLLRHAARLSPRG